MNKTSARHQLRRAWLIRHTAHVCLAAACLLSGCDVRQPAPSTSKEPAMKPNEKIDRHPAPEPSTEPDGNQPVMRFVIGEPRHTYPLLKNVPFNAQPDKPAIAVQKRGDELVLSLPLERDEAVWGFGQRLDAFNLRGTSLETWTTDGWNALHTSYYAVPFFISSEGYGMFINSTAKLRFDIGDSRNDRLTITIPDTGADIYLFRGKPDEVSRAYTTLVGRPRSAPDWIFRPWISRNSYLGAYEVDYVVNRMKKLGMPVGVVVLEAWEEELHNFKFAEHRYPDTQAWIKRLKDEQVHVICWLTSSVWENTRAYNEAKEQGFLVLNNDGSEHIVRWLENGRKIDFRKPGAFEWWRDLHKPLVEMGVDGFKTDGGEHMPDPYFHNEHAYHYQKAALDAFEGSGRDGITFARSAGPLNAGLGAFWAGDQEAEWSRLAAVIRGGLSTALSGFPLWTHDIGAYTGNPSRELYIRWLQLGVFSPLMQFHGIEAREPWHFDRETVEICRFYFGVREKLLPLLTKSGNQAVSNGTPIMRPLIWDYPDDTHVRDVDDQFLLGDDLLVAPITRPIDQRGIYLPEGKWTDLWTKQTREGPLHIFYDAPLTRLPVFVRAKKFSEYESLFTGAPKLPDNEVIIRLAGPTNERGTVPVLRYWMPGQETERIYYEIQNKTENSVNLQAAIRTEPGIDIQPGQPFTISIPSRGVQRLAFSVLARVDLPVKTYRVDLEVQDQSTRERIAAPSVGIVISPDWHVAGLFEGGVGSFQSLDGLPVQLDQVFTGKYAKVFAWQPVPSSKLEQNGRIDLNELTGRDGWSTTFLYSEIEIPKPGTYTILTGFGDAMSMWIDGKKIQSIEGHRNPLRDEDSTRISLGKGRHNILIRNSRDLAPPQFFFRIID